MPSGDKGGWFGKNVFITGIDGFVGFNLATNLDLRGANVSGLILDHNYSSPYHMDREDRKRFRVFSGDIRNYWVVERAIVESRPDFIFHLAAITQVVDAKYMPLQTYDTNIMGTANVLEAARRIRPGKIVTVIASSDKAYGEIEEFPIHEGTPLNPIHPYDVSKACGDFIARSYGRFYGEKVSITRCANIYGPGDINWQRLIPGTIKLILSGRPPVLRGNGKHIREYNYADDVIRAYLMIAKAMAGEPPETMEILSGSAWNISDEDARLSSFDILDMIQDEVGDFLPPVILGGAKDEAKKLALDSWRIAKLIGWKPQVSMKDGLAKTIEWVNEYLYGGLE